MVLLRLEVRVYPKEPPPTLSSEASGSNTSVFSRLIGTGVGNRNKEPEQNVDRRDSDELGEANPAKPYASFLLLLRNSEDLTLADLARRICMEWAHFRSDQEPLEIKKLLDEANPTVDLNLFMTVADVFVDNGKAFSDGHDQRAIVRVIQKPARYAPQRFSSVVQDWDGATNNGYQRNSRVRNQFNPIAEEEYAPASAQESPVEQTYHDAPTPSIELQPQYSQDEAIPGTPTIRSSGSEELGDSPSPEQGHKSKKRKPSPGASGPVKQRRLGGENLKNTEASVASPNRKRVNVPTFASPRRRASLSERSATGNSLGLGVTSSPLFKKLAKSDTPSSQNTGPISTPNNVATPSGSMPPPSAIRKSSPASIHSYKRRSVSFNEPILNSQSTTQASSSKTKRPQSKHSKPANKTPVSGSKGSPHVPSSSNKAAPVNQQDLDEQFARIQKEVNEKRSLEKKLKDPTTEPAARSIVEAILHIYRQIDAARKERRENSQSDKGHRITRLERKIPPLRKRLVRIETGPTTEPQQTVTETSEPRGEPETEPQPEAQRLLPAVEARVTRSMRSSAAAPPIPSQAPTWSFINAVSAPAQKPVTPRESQSPGRRGSRSSTTSSQARLPNPSSISRPGRSPSVVIYKSPRRESQSGSVNKKTPIKPQVPAENTDIDTEMKDTDENDEVATEVATQETTQEQTEEATGEPSAVLNNEADHPVIDDANPVEEHDDPENDPTRDAEMTDDWEGSAEVVSNGLVDDAAMVDENDEEGDDDKDDFVDDVPEESEDEEYQDAKDYEESSEGVAIENVHLQAEESDECNDQVGAQMNESNESEYESTEVPNGNGNLEVASNGKPDSEYQLSKSDESESGSESDPESDSEPGLEQLPFVRRSPRKQPNTPKPIPRLQSSQQLVSSQPKPAPLVTLKSLLQAAKEEAAQEELMRQQMLASASDTPAKPSVLDLTDDESSDSDGNDSCGDITYNGDSHKSRKPVLS